MENLIEIARNHYLSDGIVPMTVEVQLVDMGLILDELYQSFEEEINH